MSTLKVITNEKGERVIQVNLNDAAKNPTILYELEQLIKKEKKPKKNSLTTSHTKRKEDRLR